MTLTALCKHQRAKSLQPNSVEAQAAIGDILLTAKRDFIQLLLSSANSVVSQNANAYYNLGIALQRQKKNRKRSPPQARP